MSFVAIRWAFKQALSCTEKMVLVVLADFHNDKTGRCDPGKDSIASKAGINSRTADRVLLRLRDRGLICFDSTGGRRNNHYILNIEPESQDLTPAESRGNPGTGTGLNDSNPGTESANPGTAPPKPVRTLQPSFVKNENSVFSFDAKAVVEIYHEELPMLPAIKKLTDLRKKQIHARMKEDELSSLEDWRRFFQYVAGCPFLVNGSGNGWMPNLEWLTKQANHIKIIEGVYEPKQQHG